MQNIPRKRVLLIVLALVGNLSAAINIASGAKVTLNGSITTDTVTAATGATLQGNGLVSANVTINQGAFISPGTSLAAEPPLGSLAAGSKLTLNGTYQCDLNSTNSDFISTWGELDITNATIDFSTLTNLTGTSVIIASYNTLTGTSFGAINGLPANYEIAYDFNNGLGGNNIALVPATSPYATWASARGLDLGINSSFGDDPNKDGIPNVLHYAFDTNPLGAGNSPAKTRQQIAEVNGLNYFVITLPIRKGATFNGFPLSSNTIDGLVYSITGNAGLEGPWNLPLVELTSPLMSGLPVLGNYDGVAGSDWEYRSFRLTSTIDSLPKAFIRPVVTTSPAN